MRYVDHNRGNSALFLSLLILLSSEIRWRMTWILTLNSKVGMIFVIAFDCEYTD